jgi:uncharacterized membrane protein
MQKLFVILTLLVFTTTCSYKDSSDDISCNGVEISFAETILPIITTSCSTNNSSCHTASSKQGPGGLTNYAQVYAARTEILIAVSNGSMPMNAKLSNEERTNIICWIKNGALNN